MYSKEENKEIIDNDEADEGVKELFDSLRNTYENNL